MLTKYIKSIQATRFQQSIIFITIFYIALMLFLQYKQNYFAEENFTVNAVTETEKRLATKVETGIYINNFPEFSFYKNSFILDGVVWFRFPTGTESLDTIEKFHFKNGEILAKSDPIIQLSKNTVLISYHVVIKLITILDYKNFPVSDHKFTLIMQNKSVSPNELCFLSHNSNLDLSKDLLIGNWKPIKQYVETGFIKATFKEEKDSLIQASFPCVVYTIDFTNVGLRNFVLLYLPLFLLFFLIFISLLTAVSNITTRLSLVASVTPILALHSLVIENISPKGSSITKVDQIYLTLVVLSLIILLFQAYVGLEVKRYTGKETELIEQKIKPLKRINDIIVMVSLVTLVIVLTYTTFTN